MNTAVLGMGSWGTALAVLLGKKGFAVRLWGRRANLAERVEHDRANVQYLPSVCLPDTVQCTSSLAYALAGAEAVVLAVPSTAVREVASALAGMIDDSVLLIHAGKGLEKDTSLRGSQVVVEVLGKRIGDNCVALSGPNLAVELANDIPTATVVACPSIERAEQAQRLFHSNTLRVYRNSDITGVEMGGALKNVLAIGAGISDGLGYGDNTKATLVTRGLAEMVRLGVAVGACERTFVGLSGLGDLMATSASPLSRNLRLGRLIGQGKGVAESIESLGQVAEGTHTCRAANSLAIRHGVSAPITEQIHAMLFEGKPPKQAVCDLMSRDFKSEE